MIAIINNSAPEYGIWGLRGRQFGPDFYL